MKRVIPTLALTVVLLVIISFSAIANAELVGCEVDLAFIFDTSGSMSDEMATLANVAVTIVDDLAALGVTIHATIYLLDSYRTEFDIVPAEITVTVLTSANTGGVVDHQEDWGPGTEWVAGNHAWAVDGVTTGPRVIIPLSDEGPQNGNPVNDPGDDRDSITAAIAAATANNVLVYPVSCSGMPAAGDLLMDDLAAGTGGTKFLSGVAETDLPPAIFAIVEAACRAVPPPRPVGGSEVPINTLALLAPWIILVLATSFGAILAAKRKIKH